jgi:hypothetical protein
LRQLSRRSYAPSQDGVARKERVIGGGGSTTTSGIIPPELQGLYTGSAGSLLKEQKANPLSNYNASNPLQVAQANQLQNYGAQEIVNSGQPSGLNALSLQSILRMPGLAGAGPTTGQYNYGSEAGLGDLMSYIGGAPGQFDKTPNSTQTPPDYSTLKDALAAPPPPQGGQGVPGLPGGNDGTYTGGDDLMHPNPDGTPGRPGQGPQGGPNALPGQTPGAPQRGANQSLYEALGLRGADSGWGKSLGDINSKLSPSGITASLGTDGMPSYTSGKGGSFQFTGGQHEGAGPGGQSEFLQQALGVDPGKTNYGKVAGLDKTLGQFGESQINQGAKDYLSARDSATSPEARAAVLKAQAAKSGAMGMDLSKIPKPAAAPIVPGAPPVVPPKQRATTTVTR